MKMLFKAFQGLPTPCIFVALLALAPMAGQAQDFEYYINNGEVIICDYYGPPDMIVPPTIEGLPVTGIQWARDGGIDTVSLPASVTWIGWCAFNICDGLTDVSGGTNRTRVDEGAFVGDVSLRNFAPGLIHVGKEAFLGCSLAGGITLSEGLTDIGESAFADSGLPSVVFPNSLRTIGKCAFNECFDLATVTFGTNLTRIEDQAFGGCESLAQVSLPGSLTYIGDSTFLGTAQTNVIIPDGVQTIAGQAFASCRSLTNVFIGTNVTSIGFQVFGECDKLAAINVDPLNAAYSSADGVLLDKSGTLLIEFPGGKAGYYAVSPGVQTIADYAFAWCTKVTVVHMDSVTNIGASAFAYCDKLCLAQFSDDLAAVGENAFAGCSSLALAFLPEAVKTIGAGAFSGCTNLTQVELGDGLTTIEESLFAGCSSLSSIAIPRGVTEIKAYAFESSGLSTITIPVAVTAIGSAAFENCANLTAVCFAGDAPAVGSDVFWGADRATVYYLPGTARWGPTFAGRPTALWNPRLQTGDAAFGPHPDGFGLPITGTTNIPIVLEANASFSDPASWMPLHTCTLTNGSLVITDPDWTNYPARLNRVRSP